MQFYKTTQTYAQGVTFLGCSYLQNFEQGDVNSFLMTTPDPLGIPATLKIWHDNSGEGKKAGWYCSKVVIVDLKLGEW